jgi:hypothetical protein
MSHERVCCIAQSLISDPLNYENNFNLCPGTTKIAQIMRNVTHRHKQFGSVGCDPNYLKEART